MKQWKVIKSFSSYHDYEVGFVFNESKDPNPHGNFPSIKDARGVIMNFRDKKTFLEYFSPAQGVDKELYELETMGYRNG